MVEIDRYIDPDNSSEIIDRIKTLPNIGEIKKFIDETFPSWIVTVMDKYSHDYPHFSVNWVKVCDAMKVIPAQIILVEDIKFDDSHKVIKIFAEVLTRAGFVVRNIIDFTSCANCKRAIPAKHMWAALKEKGIDVPISWSTTCTNCT